MYVNQVLEKLKKMLCNQDYENNEFFQAVEEVFSNLKPILTKEQEKNKILERLIIPEQVHDFKVIWERDNGEIEINTGYRIQYNSSVGIYKGGLRFHPSVNKKILKFLAFEQTFKNSLTGLPMGGAKGGADIDPKTMSNSEMRRFCESFAEGINPYIGDLTDVPAGDIGVGGRELGFIYGKLKKLRNRNEFGVLSGKPLELNGSLGRKEATGYGVVYFLINMLNKYNLINNNYFPKRNEDYLENLKITQPLQGKRIVISGSGNVAIYAAEKVIQLGGKVIAMNDSNGTIIDENGIDLFLIKEIKEEKRERISIYKEIKDNVTNLLNLKSNITYIPKEEYINGTQPIWNIKNIDIALPCATQNELTLEDAKNLLKNGCKVIVEGANMPTTKPAVDFILKNKIFFSPGKASNAGGVSTSFLEMSQNASMSKWSFEKVEKEIESIMYGIFENSYETAKKYGDETNLIMGANIYSFERIAKTMETQGLIS